MPQFSYVARDAEGRKVTGSIDAASRREALAGLSGQLLYPVQVEAAAGAVEVSRVRRVPAQLVAVCYAQLADLLRSGVALLRAVEVIQRQTSHSGLRSVLGEIHRQVEEGATLADAMARFPRVFGEMAISMVRAGGEGGFLEEALTRVAEFTEAQDDLKKRTMGALAYPMVLTGFGLFVVTILLVFFVPRLEPIFNNLRSRGNLPWATDFVLGTSRFLVHHGLWLVVGAVLVGLLIRQWLLTDEGRLWRDRTKLRVPVAGKIYRSLIVARFCRVLGTLLRNGVPILRALEISSDATGNRVLASAIQQAGENVTAGERLAEPLAASGHFPPTVIEMIAVAEESNTLEPVLLNIADTLERRTWRQLDLAVRLLEPALLLILAGMVLLVVVALLLPMIQMGLMV